MRVLAFDGSPSDYQGSTTSILTSFLDGMKQAGAEVNLFYTRDLAINPCAAELDCWLNTPGACHQRDDMNRLYPKLRDSDIWVLATPVHGHRMSGRISNLLDRVLPLASPYMEVRDGHSRHVLRYWRNSGQVVLIAACALWEMDNFDPALAHVRATCETIARDFAGALLRPHEWALRTQAAKGAEEVFRAAREAGRQLVTDGKILPATLESVSRALLPLERAVEVFNETFEQEIAFLGGHHTRGSRWRTGLLARIRPDRAVGSPERSVV